MKDANALVNDVMQRLTQTFADERASLESQWSEGRTPRRRIENSSDAGSKRTTFGLTW